MDALDVACRVLADFHRITALAFQREKVALGEAVKSGAHGKARVFSDLAAGANGFEPCAGRDQGGSRLLSVGELFSPNRHGKAVVLFFFLFVPGFG